VLPLQFCFEVVCVAPAALGAWAGHAAAGMRRSDLPPF
jgi:hypothetical protein